MTQQQIAKRLRKALLEKGKMAQALYEYELKEHIDYWYEGLKRDKNEFVFVVTENSGDVAMALITADKTVYINEDGRQKLAELWLKAYKSNIERLVPTMVKNLSEGFVFVTGVNTLDTQKQKQEKGWSILKKRYGKSFI